MDGIPGLQPLGARTFTRVRQQRGQLAPGTWERNRGLTLTL